MSTKARLAAVLYSAAGAVYLLDRMSKVVVERTLAGRPPIVIIPAVLDLTHTTNSGGAFSLLAGAPWLFFAASVVVVTVIAVASFRLPSRLLAVSLGLIMGGAVGNLTDRLVRGHGISGRVVDFIDFRVWPVFNLADSAIVVGAILVALASLRRPAAVP